MKLRRKGHQLTERGRGVQLAQHAIACLQWGSRKWMEITCTSTKGLLVLRCTSTKGLLVLRCTSTKGLLVLRCTSTKGLLVLRCKHLKWGN